MTGRKADDILDKIGIDYELIVQDNPTKSCDDAAEERGLETRQIVKSLIIERNPKGNPQATELLHVLIPGDRELSEKKIGEHRLIPPETSKQITGFESGKIHPFSTDLKHLVDSRLFKQQKLSHTIGETEKGVILNSTDFRKALDNLGFEYSIGDYVVHNEKDIEKLKQEGLTEQQAQFVASNEYIETYLELKKEGYEPSKIVKLFQEINREQAEIQKNEAKDILEVAENETHIQNMVQTFTRKGEIPEKQDFDLQETINHVIDENKDAVNDFVRGKESALNFMIGEVMKETKGQANPETVKAKILDELKTVTQ